LFEVSDDVFSSFESSCIGILTNGVLGLGLISERDWLLEGKERADMNYV